MCHKGVGKAKMRTNLILPTFPSTPFFKFFENDEVSQRLSLKVKVPTLIKSDLV